ncbi:MAG: cysteine desulfurase NifS [Clostridia bacterium]|nr:cysteine desulfurase NifS [Clostridia bacterium]MBR6640717.1 cysteine desulfurase NifS [Clostridia bacterium]
MDKIIYVDHSATTYVKKEVLDEMLPYFTEKYGNASSPYKIGGENRNAVEKAREQVAKAINAEAREIYFTAGGSESDNMIIRGIAYANKKKGNHIITCKIEHPAVLETCKALEKEGFEVTYLSVDENGFISLDELRNSIKDTTILVSIMFANNEIGTIQNISEITKITKFKGVYFHTDAVQAVGNVNIDVEALGIDALSMSAHKFYGPKGIGAAYIKKTVKFTPIITGGHQEKGKRAGTENVPAIVGMGKAIELAAANIESYNKKLMELRDYTIDRILNEIPYVKLNGDRNSRLAGSVNISFKGIEGESLLLMLDMKNIEASSGSACTSGSLDPSHVLLAIGLKHEIAHGSLRLSYGECNTMEDAKYIVDSLIEIVARLREMSPLDASVM